MPGTPGFARCSFAALCIAAAPLSLAAQSPKAAPTAAGAVEEFMRALADSNLSRMAQLFGNGKGSAYRTHQPKDYEKRIVIMQAMLHGAQARTLGDVPNEKDGGRTVTTQLTSNGCKVTLPVNVVKASEGWLVHDFKLEAAAEVNKPCETTKRPGNF
jgi:hypothetical protein